MYLIRFLTFSLLISCSQNAKKSPKSQLEGMWYTEPITAGDTALWENWIDAGDTNDYHRIVRKLDSGMYDFNYKNSELVRVELFKNLLIEEFIFSTDTSGILYSYELDTTTENSRHPRIGATNYDFEIRRIKDSFQLIQKYDDSLFYRANIQFITEKAFELTTSDSLKTVLVKFNEP